MTDAEYNAALARFHEDALRATLTPEQQPMLSEVIRTARLDGYLAKADLMSAERIARYYGRSRGVAFHDGTTVSFCNGKMKLHDRS